MLALAETKDPCRLKATSKTILQLQEEIRAYLRTQNNGEELLRLEYAFEDITTHQGHLKRKSGEPMIVHPLRVAWSICEAGLDAPTVIVALLHDLIEDTEITKDQIRRRYGEWYAEMVDGLTKIIELDASGKSKANLHATYHKMLSTMVKDVRVLFIKMFDRLDNMRDLDPMPREKQRRISQETHNVYVPLAKRLGLEKIAQEYSTLCFKYLYPARYQKTLKKLRQLKKDRQSAIQNMQDVLQEALSPLASAEVEPIYIQAEAYIQKMEVDRMLSGFRILVDNALMTYQVLGALHTAFRAVPLQIRDFISNPRWDGYKGLRTELLIEGEMVCIEIASREMHTLNSHGIMASWQGTPSELAEYYRIYLEQIDHIVGEKEPRMEEVLRYSQVEQVQVFTPIGEVYFFPKGATILDFAYHIHSDLGNTCIGAFVHISAGAPSYQTEKIRVPRERELFSGERIEILTDSSTRPHRDWLGHIFTTKSKIEIQRALRTQNMVRTRQVGESSFRKELRKLGENEEEFLASNAFQAALRAEKYTFEELLEKIGTKQSQIRRFLKKYNLVSQGKLNRRNWQVRVLESFFKKEPPQFFIEDMDDSFLRFPTCCSALAGDRVVGYLKEEQGLEIHRRNCQKIRGAPHAISVGWLLPEDSRLQKRNVHLLTVDKPGVLYQITKIIKNLGVGILDIRSERTGSEASIRLTLEPIRLGVYHKILVQLRSLKIVHKIV